MNVGLGQGCLSARAVDHLPQGLCRVIKARGGVGADLASLRADLDAVGLPGVGAGLFPGQGQGRDRAGPDQDDRTPRIGAVGDGDGGLQVFGEEAGQFGGGEAILGGRIGGNADGEARHRAGAASKLNLLGAGAQGRAGESRQG